MGKFNRTDYTKTALQPPHLANIRQTNLKSTVHLDIYPCQRQLSNQLITNPPSLQANQPYQVQDTRQLNTTLISRPTKSTNEPTHLESVVSLDVQRVKVRSLVLLHLDVLLDEKIGPFPFLPIFPLGVVEDHVRAGVAGPALVRPEHDLKKLTQNSYRGGVLICCLP